MKRTRRWIFFLIAALAVVFLIVKWVSKGKNNDVKVTAETVKRRTIVETVSASGKLYPETEIKLGSPISGEVTLLNVQEGDSVTKGQILARVQGEKGAVATPQRVALPASIPPGFESLVQSMQQPSVTTSQTSATIIAPISGTVIALNVKKGERIGAMQMPGSELLRIADMKAIEVQVDVNENNIIKIAIGDSADVEVEAYNKRRFKGIVTSIANGSTKKNDATSFLSNDVTAYQVHIRLLPSSYADLFANNSHKVMPFRPGMNARADIKTKKHENALSIPVGAVVSKPKGSDEDVPKKESGDETATDETWTNDELEEAVYILKTDGAVEKRTVTTGIQDINFFEIVNGLKEGEQVITGPYGAVSKTLKTGSKVTVVPKEKLFQNE